MRDTGKTLSKYLLTVGIGLAASIFILFLRGFSFDMPPVSMLAILADAFSIPGIVLVCVSLLIWVASEGTFDMIGYGFGRAASSLIPFMRKNDETFYDYKVRKKEGRDGRSYWFVCFVGLGFILVAGIFLVIYCCI